MKEKSLFAKHKRSIKYVIVAFFPFSMFWLNQFRIRITRGHKTDRKTNEFGGSEKERTLLVKDRSAMIAIYNRTRFSHRGNLIIPEPKPVCLSNTEIENRKCAKIEKNMLSFISKPVCPSRNRDCKKTKFIPINSIPLRGTTAYFSLEPFVKNICHWTGRFGLILFLLRRERFFSGSQGYFENIIIDTGGEEIVFNLLKNPDSWQGTSLRLLLGIETIRFIDSRLKQEDAFKMFTSNSPRIVVVKDMKFVTGKYGLVLDRMITIGINYGKFFVEEDDIPYRYVLRDSKTIEYPLFFLKDSEFFRTTAYQYALDAKNRTDEFEVERKLVYMMRGNERRIFSKKAELLFQNTLKMFCTSYNYNFVTLNGTDTSFKSQVLTAMNAKIAVGIHGANLVNTMFIHRSGTVVELFPPAYQHVVYINGGGTVSGYFPMNISAVIEYPNINEYEDRDVCIEQDSECRSWYLNASHPVDFQKEDVSKLLRILEKIDTP